MAVIKTENRDGGAGMMQAPRTAALHRPRDWFRFFEDFFSIPQDDQTPYLPTDWLVTEDSADGVHAVMTGEIGGVYQLACHSDAHDEATMVLGGRASGTICEIAKNSGKPLFYECRFKCGAVADSGFVIGLSEESVGADLMVDTTTVLKLDIDFLGFRSLIGAPTELDAVHQLASTTIVEAAAAAGTLTTTAWMTVAIHFDGEETVKWYIDDELVASADVDDTGFPVDEELTPCFGVKCVTGAAIPLYIDYVEVIQKR